MKMKIYAVGLWCLLSVCLTMPARGISLAGDSTNLAALSAVSTSFISSWETLAAVKDGYEPANSLDHSHGAYGNWSGEEAYNTYNWVQYEWPLAQNITSTSVYWWDDGLGIDQPTEAYIMYWNGSAWVNGGGIGLLLDQYNSRKIIVRANKMRIYMKSAMATGIIEWKVFGVANTSCTPSVITNSVEVNNNAIEQTSYATLVAGDSLLLLPDTPDTGDWTWSGPDGFTATTKELKLRNIKVSQGGTYTVTLLNACGAYTKSYFYVSVRTTADASAHYTWPVYDPTISYNFRDEFPALAEPTSDLDDCAGVVGKQSSGWWVFKWGATANPLVTTAAITPMLQRMNTDFAYFRDVMGWPPDKRAKRGYRSAIYLYGSSLCTDDKPNTATGGWQGSIDFNGESWPMVLISYYPVYCYDPACPYTDKLYQTGAVVHEGIHSVLADLPGCRNAAWFHEGGNTWLQQEADSRRSGDYSSMGFLNGASFIAPFMPVECYSGWLQDGSFGGPSAEGVNRTNSSGDQICTWRNLLGGVQYSNTFPTFLGVTLGQGSIPWIWRYCPTRVLEGMAEYMGDTQMRRLIMEYRAKQALVDMGPWTNAINALLDAQFGTAIKAEWSPYWINVATWNATPYAKTTNTNGLLIPEARTTPGWSGANIIPLKTTGNVVTVNFQPASPNMSCQLCYRSEDGQAVYGTPVFGGNCSIKLDPAPANTIVFAVICNTNYIYEGETTRTAHYSYKLQIVEGVTGTADINKKWFKWNQNIISDVDDITLSDGPEATVFPNPVDSRTDMNIRFSEQPSGVVTAEIWNFGGKLIQQQTIAGDGTLNTAGKLEPGVYFMVLKTKDSRCIEKIIVN